MTQLIDSVEKALAARRKADEERGLNIWTPSFSDDEVRSQALAIDRQIGDGELSGPLAGELVVVKDNIATTDFETTCSSRILAGWRSPYDATVIRRLRAAGAIIFGKTNCDEFAMGSSTEHSAYGTTRNPHDPARVPGGSSGGSAAAIAADVVNYGLGTETGGSVRQPAAFCGVVGVKPTYGRVSRYGAVAFASSLDQIGPLSHDVRGSAELMNVIAGHDPFDSTSATHPRPDYVATLEEGVKGKVIGVPTEYFPEMLDPSVAALCRSALDRFESMGAQIRELSMPHTSAAIPAYYVVAPAEASSNLARFDGVRYGPRVVGNGDDDIVVPSRSAGFGEEVQRRILLGTYVLSQGYKDAYYDKAIRVIGLIRKDFSDAFASGIDLLFTPTTPGPAFKIGEKTGDPYEMYLSDIFTATANLAGVPAMSLPIGTVNGLPIGGQLIAPWWGEAGMFAAAFALESSLASGEG